MVLLPSLGLDPPLALAIIHFFSFPVPGHISPGARILEGNVYSACEKKLSLPSSHLSSSGLRAKNPVGYTPQ